MQYWERIYKARKQRNNNFTKNIIVSTYRKEETKLSSLPIGRNKIVHQENILGEIIVPLFSCFVNPLQVFSGMVISREGVQKSHLLLGGMSSTVGVFNKCVECSESLYVHRTAHENYELHFSIEFSSVYIIHRHRHWKKVRFYENYVNYLWVHFEL